ncbi:uncharacterized protein METZ01_LOCUS459990, partial [marine metagenome]
MIKKVFTTFLILATSICLAQKHTVSGTILDKVDNAPLIGANIMLDGTNHGAASDKNGKFSIPNVEAGDFTIVASYMGYSTFTQEISVPNDENSSIAIALDREAIKLDEYVVTASRRRERIEDAPAAISI